MPRRRMIGPEFWTDRYIATLDRNERLLVVGGICNADDEGRLVGHPAYLKAAIFMYDTDLDAPAVEALRDSCLAKMASWPSTHPYRFVSYQNSGETYLVFPSWYDIEKPSHPTKSKLPPPPPDSLPIFSGNPPEIVEKLSGEPPPQSRSGQSSLGQVSIGQVSVVREDFTKLLDNEKDLTDFLTKTLTFYMAAGRQRARQDPEATIERERTSAAHWSIPVLEKFWLQATGDKLSGVVWQGAHDALQKYPPDIIALAFVKAGPYGGGKHKSWKYFQTIIDEEMGKRAPPRNRSP